ncbi:hypothetical protein CEXT_645781 [Caerostris extrusa]|uniref:Uncharacterized protein n=1 Tax=Caerostris extrusa TaxID=172846 RepID=A0AAV4Y9Y0_CAEEX|nr:hypothetical protein CEXT_645781 [Caerostris extrusa]
MLIPFLVNTPYNQINESAGGKSLNNSNNNNNNNYPYLNLIIPISGTYFRNTFNYYDSKDIRIVKLPNTHTKSWPLCRGSISTESACIIITLSNHDDGHHHRIPDPTSRQFDDSKDRQNGAVLQSSLALRSRHLESYFTSFPGSFLLIRC